MKKFDFSKEFGNIDSKYIHEAEKEWQMKNNSLDTKVLEQSRSSMCDHNSWFCYFFQSQGAGRN